MVVIIIAGMHNLSLQRLQRCICFHFTLSFQFFWGYHEKIEMNGFWNQDGLGRMSELSWWIVDKVKSELEKLSEYRSKQ